MRALPSLPVEGRHGAFASGEFFPASSVQRDNHLTKTSRLESLRNIFATLIAGADVLVWLACFSLGISLLSFLGKTPILPNFSVGVLPLASIVIVLSAIGGYDRRSDMLSLEFTSLYLIALAVTIPIAIILVYVFGTYGADMQPSRSLIPLSIILFAPLSLLSRRLLVSVLHLGSRAEGGCLAIGTDRGLREFSRLVGEEFDKTFNTLELNAARAEMGEEWIAQLQRSYSRIVLAGNVTQFPSDLMSCLVSVHFHRTPVYTMESYLEDHCRMVSLANLRPEWLFHDRFLLARRSVFCYAKRGFDILASSAVLLLLAPFLAVLWAAIRLESKGPAIFRQQRVGRDGHVFTMYKFRSMRQVPQGDIYTRKDDERITRLGKRLRVTRLDELPQLWNVLKGDMSLIGPRAEWVNCTAIYEEEIPNYHLRHLVRPGITGWAQVNHPYGESLEDARTKLSYDLYYIRHFSLLLDWSIVLKTIYVILGGKGR